MPQFEEILAALGLNSCLHPVRIGYFPIRPRLRYFYRHRYWWCWVYVYAHYKRSQKLRDTVDRNILKIPVIGEILKKASIARFTRTLATTFAAGVPLIGAPNPPQVHQATQYTAKPFYTCVKKWRAVCQCMLRCATQVFPDMVTQMIAIGEESGAVDEMLSKIATIYEAEVDDMVDGLTSLLEPMIMAVLGVVIGGLIVAMYLPIFQMGNVV